MELIDLKKECAVKKQRAEKLYKEKFEKEIERDLMMYCSAHPERLTKQGYRYVFDNDFYVNISDGNLEIEDRRGRTILWVFGIDCDYTYLDTFVYKGHVQSAQFVTDPKMSEYVVKVIERLDDTIKRLREDEIIDYSCLCVEPSVKADSISEVFEKVLQNKQTRSQGEDSEDIDD